MIIIRLSIILLAVSAFAQVRTPAECAQIRQFNVHERNENRGMKPAELERECGARPAPRKSAPKKPAKRAAK
jgi:hypothetical protein